MSPWRPGRGRIPAPPCGKNVTAMQLTEPGRVGGGILTACPLIFKASLRTQSVAPPISRRDPSREKSSDRRRLCGQTDLHVVTGLGAIADAACFGLRSLAALFIVHRRRIVPGTLGDSEFSSGELDGRRRQRIGNRRSSQYRWAGAGRSRRAISTPEEFVARLQIDRPPCQNHPHAAAARSLFLDGICADRCGRFEATRARGRPCLERRAGLTL